MKKTVKLLLVASFLIILLVTCRKKSAKIDNTANNSNKTVVDKSSTSKSRELSTKDKKYVMPLINEDEKKISIFGKITKRNERKSENGNIHVAWFIDNKEYIDSLKSEIISNFITKDMIKILNIDLKSYVPMSVYRSFTYENYDKSLDAYLKNEVYNDIINYIEYGNSLHYEPYNAEIANWYKYFEFEVRRPKESDFAQSEDYWEAVSQNRINISVKEKADYTHWYFDNGKTGTEEEYNALKNKYKPFLTNSFVVEGVMEHYNYIAVDDETYNFLMEHDGIFPNAINKITIADINNFDRATEKLLDYYLDGTYGKVLSGSTAYIKKAVDLYNKEFNSFVIDHWQEYPDSMNLHLEFEKQSQILDFSKFLELKLKEYEEWDDPQNYYDGYMYSICHKLIYNDSRARKEEGEYLFKETRQVFEKDHSIKDYISLQRNLLINDYHNTDEYKDRLKLFNQLISFENARIIAQAAYSIRDDKYDEGAYRRNFEISVGNLGVLPVYINFDIATTNGWTKRNVLLFLDENGKLFTDDHYWSWE